MAKIETNEQQLDTIAKDSVSQRFVDTIVLKTDTVANEFFGPNLNDSVTYLPDNPMLDSLLMPQDSILSDSLAQPKDTIVTKRSSAALETKIVCTATDSVVRNLADKKMYYYGDAEAKYDDIVLKAACLEFDLETNVCKAYGTLDSVGRLQGTPVFSQGNSTFDAEEMMYNFKSKKGVITKVWTEEGQGYLNGTKIKRMDDNTVNISVGGYTTCDLKDHPHYQFRFSKAKVIPDDKIVTGPIFLTIEDVPLPLALPFALVPLMKGQKSGLIIPTYGESANRGFYLENGGYYWVINEHMDLQVLGDIYTRGSWALKPTFRYVKRYKYNGNLSLGYAVNKIGTKNSADFQKSTDFKILWSHKQDPKAHPRHSFSADVNIMSSNYNQYNASTSNEYLSNTFKSSIAYQTNFDGKVYLTLNAGHSQNTLTKQITISLPEITLSANRIYPLQKVGKQGKRHWYKDLNVNYTLNAKNYISGADSSLFSHGWYKDMGMWSKKNMQMGAKHSIPINLPIKLFKHINWTSSVSLNDYMYFSHTEKQMLNDSLITDTIYGFRNLVDFSVSSNFTTKIYGMVNFAKGPIRAIRHVFTPTIGFSYTPDFSSPRWGAYGRYMDAAGVEQVYNMFTGSLYGSPSQNASGSITYNFANNLEMKVPSKSDTITGLKKVALLESFNLGGNYDLMRDSLNLSNLSISARTTLFKKLNIQYSSVWDPYTTNENGERINRLEIVENHRLFHKNNSAWNFSVSFSLNQSTIDKLKNKNAKEKDFGADVAKRAANSPNVTEDQLLDIMGNPNAYVDWTTPWSLSLSYNLRYSSSLRYAALLGIATNQTVQTLSVNGDISLSPKWKITFNTGWDFTNHGLSYTSVNIYRDLHCWEMRFGWIPTGRMKSWNFTINVKAQALKDLKLTKKKDHRDTW